MNLIIAVAILFSAAMGGTVYASNDAMPGDALYGVKQTVENIRLAASPNDPALQLEIANARLSETEKLLDAGRKDDAQTSLNDFVSAAGKARDLLQQTNTVPNASVIKEVEKQKTTIQIIESQLGGSSIEVQKAKIVVKSIETEIEIEIEIEIEHGIEIEHEDRLKTPRAVKTEDGSKTPEATQTEDKTKTPKPSSTDDNKIKTPEPTKLGEDKVKTVEPAKVETKVTEVKPAETRKPESTPKPAETKKADDKKSNSGSNSGKK
ncbi:MAG: DUF5667 domain-containing protein [Chloroflexota bacterium]